MNKAETLTNIIKNVDQVELSYSDSVHLRRLKQQEMYNEALTFRNRQIASKKEMRLKGLVIVLESRLEQEIEPLGKAETELALTWFHNFMGEINDKDRKSKIEKMVEKYGPEVFKKLAVEKDDNNKTKAREILETIAHAVPRPNDGKVDRAEVEFLILGKDWLPAEMKIETEFRSLLWQEKQGKLPSDQRIEKILAIYGSYPKEITEEFKKKASVIMAGILSPR